MKELAEALVKARRCGRRLTAGFAELPSVERGYAVQEAMDGVEAVEAALRLVPAAVVMDRILPRLRAEEVADRLRANPATQRVPLFVLSGQADMGDQARMFDGFIPKPLSKNALAAAIGILEGTLGTS